MKAKLILFGIAVFVLGLLGWYSFESIHLSVKDNVEAIERFDENQIKKALAGEKN